MFLYKDFYRIYINNVMIFNNIKEKHLFNVNIIFKYFENISFFLLIKKSFYEYTLIKLLNFKVNGFEIIII